MAVPARRTSKAKKAKRRTHYKMSVPGMSTCSNCGEMKRSHHVCPACGHYDGKDVKTTEA
ncbi:50S ribosomal protein L32 [Vagococcus coleopterorum]|uniref:Large ribosomal subunit protein bL32 n=1 Tax=Vagococcus coleopterorum TaxID=2714946 RepID=A0A6G8AMZ5_9ENTE|nr:50S ribosomal protein L32 [Vagococcus coleopterorum]QIL46438.1 50S ribosomal protein L32 [Vagococcus coleopterorum]